MNESTPVFVKVDEYKEVLDILEVIKTKISSAEKVITEVKRLKDEEDRQLDSWSDNLDDVTSKINEIDTTVFGKR